VAGKKGENVDIERRQLIEWIGRDVDRWNKGNTNKEVDLLRTNGREAIE
jgi:hypothetical protein